MEHFFGRALKKKNWDREFQDIVDIVPRSGAEALSAELRLRKARSIVAHTPPTLCVVLQGRDWCCCWDRWWLSTQRGLFGVGRFLRDTLPSSLAALSQPKLPHPPL